jgi:hypothetical protein
LLSGTHGWHIHHFPVQCEGTLACCLMVLMFSNDPASMIYLFVGGREGRLDGRNLIRVDDLFSTEAQLCALPGLPCQGFQISADSRPDPTGLMRTNRSEVPKSKDCNAVAIDLRASPFCVRATPSSMSMQMLSTCSVVAFFIFRWSSPGI